MTWLLCTLLGHNQVSNPHAEFVTSSGRCMFPVEHVCARRGCDWTLTTWAKGEMA